MECPRAEVGYPAFFVTARYDAKSLWFTLAFEADVERVRGAAADPPPHPATDEGIVCGSAGNGQFQRVMLENTNSRFSGIPGRNDFNESRCNPFRVEDTSIEQNRVWRAGLRVRFEEGRHVTSDGGILSIRQAEFL